MPRRNEPVGAADVEVRLARSGAAAVLCLAPVVVAGAAAVAGVNGALSATLPALLIVGGCMMTALPMPWAAARGPEALFAVTLGGFMLRLAVYAALVVTVRPLDVIHGPSLAVSGAVLLVASLLWEIRTALRTPGFFWVSVREPAQAPKGSLE